ncbi:hypothetical protein HX900_00145 [Rhizobium sp. WYCCWR 11290]|uniref:Uncharacterized protein n=1 Tax=Rhizobium changzhiense TaxID=2692317 RepID=A0A7Z0RDG5_9HYPH|nr:hypothetical protein [Rhizobium changzhiense]NZD59537.1 hypothetical protein [Rhizobium changzhiense]
MSNATAPAAAEAVSIIDVIDQLAATRSFLTLVAYALEGMTPDEEVNAMQYGVEHIRREVQAAEDMLQAIRRQV